MASRLTAWVRRLTGRSAEARNRRADDADQGPIAAFAHRLKGAAATAGGPVGYSWNPPPGQPGHGGAPGGRPKDRRRAPTAYAPPAAAPGGGEWSLPGGAGRGASPNDAPTRRAEPGPAEERREPVGQGAAPGGAGAGKSGGSAFDRSAIPAPIARITERLGEMLDESDKSTGARRGLGRRFVETLDRLTGGAHDDPPPRPAANPPGNGPAPGKGPTPPGQGAPPHAGPMRGLGWTGPPVGGEWSEVELIQDVKEASRRETSKLGRKLLRFLLGFFVVFFVWAAVFQIDEVTRGEGKVIASSQTQVLANLEGGILSAVLVREGDKVEKGQPMVRLTNLQAVAQYADNRAKFLSLSAQVARLTAEVTGQPVSFPAEVVAEAPEVVRAESALMTARLTQFETQMQILRDQRAQRTQELADVRNKASKLGQQLTLAREQLAILEPLAAEGLAPRVDVIRAQRDRTQSDSDLESARLSIPRAEAALREAERKIEERMQTFKADSQKDLNEKKTQLEGVTEQQRADRDRVRRTEVVAPLRGTVKQIFVKTIGGVVKPGQEIVEVVPLEDTLLVEVKVPPADIGFVHVGQHASVKVTAYDYSIYGSLEAKVEDVSADSIVDPADREQRPFFRVRLVTKKSAFASKAGPLPIQPGMTVSADILTGERSVLTYLMKPFFKTFKSALGER